MSIVERLGGFWCCKDKTFIWIVQGFWKKSAEMEVVFNRCWVFRDVKCGICKPKSGQGRVYNSSCLSVSPPSLHVHYRHFNTTTGQSATEADFGTFLSCSLLSAFPLAFRILLPMFRQRACITVLSPLCRMPQCYREVIALLVARTVRH